MKKTKVAPRRRSFRTSRLLPLFGVLCLVPTLVPRADAQNAVMPASTMAPAAAGLPDGPPATQAAFLVNEAFSVAASNPSARPVAVRTAAALLPRVANRDALTGRWMKLLMSGSLTTPQQLSALDSFFDVAARIDPDYARAWAVKTASPSARSGAFLRLSRAVEPKGWGQADDLLGLAQAAARKETNALRRARALVFVAYRATELSPARAEGSIREASSNIALLTSTEARDNLYTELAGATARFDLALAREMANRVTNEKLKNLALARVNIVEVSQSTITTRSKERVQALATAAAPYDSRALPFLLQLPPTVEVLKAISQTLPAIYPSAQPAIEVEMLERIWDYTQKAPAEGEAALYRDQLQSRVARLMVLKDLWRGRDWGKQLSWKGGRIQVGAFLKDVLASRSSQLKAGALQDVAKRNVQAALTQARNLEPAARSEALLLLAGQLLG